VADAGLTHGDWLERVPQLLNDCAEEWTLRLGEPYPQSAAGYVVRAERDDGTPVALKLIYPHREAEHEGEALRVWDGDGAVALLASWHDELPSEWERAGRPFERELLDKVTETLRALAASQGEQVLLHQDLHTDNVLAAEREPWLVIDPKPLLGEREFNVAPIVRDYVLGHSRDEVVRRLDRLTSELGLDRERALGWAIGQTVAWMFESTQLQKHLEMVRWLVEARA
jgi:streptomycin 6-kinase